MRFFVTGEQHRKYLINSIVLMFLGYITLFWLSNGLLYFHKMSLNPESVIAYYLGSEEQFTQAKSYGSMLEVSHFHLFAMGLLVLTLTHLLLFAEIPVFLKIGLTGFTFVAAVMDELSGWLVRFVHPLFAWFKIAAFVSLEISLFSLVVLVGHSLIKSRQKGKAADQGGPVG